MVADEEARIRALIYGTSSSLVIWEEAAIAVDLVAVLAVAVSVEADSAVASEAVASAEAAHREDGDETFIRPSERSYPGALICFAFIRRPL